MADKRNYRREMDAIVEGLQEKGERPALLLHSCCAPCSTACLELLAPYFDITVFFYNPNILPAEEFEKRLYWQRYLLETAPFAKGVKLLVPEREEEAFWACARGLEQAPEGGERCTRCFALRLGRTAAAAREGGFDWFATTLTVSPHKDAERINGIGFTLAEGMARKAGEGGAAAGTDGGAAAPRWLPTDFKKKNGYLRSIELSKEYGLYRQNWCGCGLGPED